MDKHIIKWGPLYDVQLYYKIKGIPNGWYVSLDSHTEIFGPFDDKVEAEAYLYEKVMEGADD